MPRLKRITRLGWPRGRDARAISPAYDSSSPNYPLSPGPCTARSARRVRCFLAASYAPCRLSDHHACLRACLCPGVASCAGRPRTRNVLALEIMLVCLPGLGGTYSVYSTLCADRLSGPGRAANLQFRGLPPSCKGRWWACGALVGVGRLVGVSLHSF